MYTLEGKRNKDISLRLALKFFNFLFCGFFLSDGPIDFHLHSEASEKQPEIFSCN